MSEMSTYVIVILFVIFIIICIVYVSICHVSLRKRFKISFSNKSGNSGGIKRNSAKKKDGRFEKVKKDKILIEMSV